MSIFFIVTVCPYLRYYANTLPRQHLPGISICPCIHIINYIACPDIKRLCSRFSLVCIYRNIGKGTDGMTIVIYMKVPTISIFPFPKTYHLIFFILHYKINHFKWHILSIWIFRIFYMTILPTSNSL